MLSEKIVEELTRRSPLRSELLKTAWPALSTESKLQLIDAAASPLESTPGDIAELALKDPVSIVRYWAARSYHFNRLRPDEHGKRVGFLRPTPEELGITARADADACALVRAAATPHVFGLGGLVALPQLARLVKLRTASHPGTGSLATFIEAAVTSGGASVQEVRECIWEYFAREDVKHELEELDDDGFTEFSKTGGYERLWTIAATAPTGIAQVIAIKAALEGKLWKVKLPQLLALPDKVKQVVVGRNEEPAEQLREAIKSSPDKYSKSLVDAVDSYYKMVADPDNPNYSADDLEEFRLEDMPNRQHAVFLSVKKLRKEVSVLRGALAEAPKLADLNAAVQQIMSRLFWGAIGLGITLYLAAHAAR